MLFRFIVGYKAFTIFLFNSDSSMYVSEIKLPNLLDYLKVQAIPVTVKNDSPCSILVTFCSKFHDLIVNLIVP